jgi:pimeloyl-ACP methyl ester carboxylesterase
MRHKPVEIDGIDIFYREAGGPKSPQLVLLHGFPSSSHQYRNRMAAFADRFHMASPRDPGFGNSDRPEPAKFSYTFDTASIVEKFLDKVGFTRFGLYVQDYGGPVGFRIVLRHSDRLEWLIIQNTNANEIGFTPAWDELSSNYWKTHSAESEKAIGALLEPETVKVVCTTGHPNPELISPDFARDVISQKIREFYDKKMLAAAGIDQCGRDDGQRAALLDVARRAEESPWPLQRIGVDTAGQYPAG